MSTYDFISIAKNNPDNKVTLEYGTGTLELLMSEEVSLSTGNSWEAPLDGKTADAAGSTVSTGLKMAQQAFGSDFQIKNIRESILYYNGSKSLDLRLSCMLIADTESDQILQQLSPLLDLTNPEFDPNGTFDFTMPAPLGYTVKLGDPTGKVAVMIGQWFKSTRVYVLDDASWTVSKAKVNGKPLYLNVQISLRPCRMLSASEVKSFLQ